MRWTATCLAVLLLLGCRPRPESAEAPDVPPEHWEQNLAPNPSLERDEDGDGAPDAWSLPQGIAAWDSSEARDGSHSLRFTNTDPHVYRLATAPLSLIPGVRYRYSVAVKGKDIRSSNPSDQGAGICIEWMDAEGEWLGGSYAPCRAGTFGWTRVGGESARVPAEAARGHVVLYLRKKSVGTAWFDEVEVRAIRGPLMRLTLLEPAYRATFQTSLEPRQVVLEVAVNRREHAVARGGLRLAIAVRDRQGHAVADYPVRRLPPPAGDEPALVRVTVPALPVGAYHVHAELRDRDGLPLAQDTARFHVVPPVERRVGIDERRRLVVDGEPFFPLGIYLGPTEDEHLARIAAAGFNAILCYGYGVGKKPEAYLDRARKHGLKVIYSIKDLYEGSRWFPKHKGQEDIELVRDTVTRFRDHPALLAWYTNDELGPAWMPKLQAAYDLVRTLDPHHPTFQVLCRPAEAPRYYGVTDVLGVDPYPIPSRPVTMVGEWMDAAHAAMRERKPAWCVPQIFGWGVYRHDPSIREPTFDEKRAMVYLALVHRAQGLVCYSYYDQFKGIEKGSRVPDEVFQRRWDEVARIAGVVAQAIPALLKGEETAAERQGSLRYRVLQLPTGACVIAVNTDPARSLTAAIPVPCGTVAEQLDTGRSVPVQEGQLRDLLAPLGAAIYWIE